MNDQIIYYEKYIRLPVTVAPCCRCRCRCNCQRWSESTVANIHGKILLSKSRAIAPKFMPPGGAQLAQDLQRSLSIVASVGMLRRVRLRVISSGFRTENFEFFSAAANFCVRNRRETAPKSVPLLRCDLMRSPAIVPRVGMLRSARLRAIPADF